MKHFFYLKRGDNLFRLIENLSFKSKFNIGPPDFLAGAEYTNLKSFLIIVYLITPLYSEAELYKFTS